MCVSRVIKLVNSMYLFTEASKAEAAQTLLTLQSSSLSTRNNQEEQHENECELTGIEPSDTCAREAIIQTIVKPTETLTVFSDFLYIFNHD